MRIDSELSLRTSKFPFDG